VQQRQSAGRIIPASVRSLSAVFKDVVESPQLAASNEFVNGSVPRVKLAEGSQKARVPESHPSHPPTDHINAGVRVVTGNKGGSLVTTASPATHLPVIGLVPLCATVSEERDSCFFIAGGAYESRSRVKRGRLACYTGKTQVGVWASAGLFRSLTLIDPRCSS
jgi:hypothetical protein